MKWRRESERRLLQREEGRRREEVDDEDEAMNCPFALSEGQTCFPF